MPSRLLGVFLLLLVGTLAATDVRAGGFSQPDQHAWAMGMGGAFTARASGASALGYNAAGLAFGDRPELALGASVRLSRGRFTGADPFPGGLAEEQQRAVPRLLPTFDYAHPVGPRVVLGLGLHAPFDLQSEWDTPSAFSGRYIAYRSSLSCYTLTPAVAVRLADRLAVGAGLDVHFSSLTVMRRLGTFDPFTQRRVDGADMSIDGQLERSLGYRLGVLARLNQTVSFGVAYRHRTPIDMSGEATVERLATGQPQLDSSLGTLYPPGAVPFTVETALPSLLTVGVAVSHNDWTLTADYGIEKWSSFGTVSLDFEEQGIDLGPTTLAREFEDTSQIRVGVERRLNHAWTMRGGYAYDPSPAPTSSLSPFFVDADRHCFAVGFGHSRGGWRIDLAAGARFEATRATDGTSPEGYDGTYENLVPVLGVSIGRTF